MVPIPDIILLIMPSMSKLGIPPIPHIPPIDIIPPGIGAIPGCIIIPGCCIPGCIIIPGCYICILKMFLKMRGFNLHFLRLILKFDSLIVFYHYKITLNT